MNVEIYKAFKEAGVSEEIAQAAGKAFEEKEDRLTGIEIKDRLTAIERERLPAIEKEIHLLKWMVGVVIAGILYLVLRTVPL